MIGPFRIYFNSRRSLETEGRTNRSTGSGIRSRQGTAGGSSASGCCVVGRHWQASCQWHAALVGCLRVRSTEYRLPACSLPDGRVSDFFFNP